MSDRQMTVLYHFARLCGTTLTVGADFWRLLATMAVELTSANTEKVAVFPAKEYFPGAGLFFCPPEVHVMFFQHHMIGKDSR